MPDRQGFSLASEKTVGAIRESETPNSGDGAQLLQEVLPERITEIQGSSMIGQEFIHFLEIGTIAVLMILLLQLVH